MIEETSGLQLDRARLDMALETARLGEFEWDIARDVFKVSRRMAAITGMPVGEIQGDGRKALYEIIPRIATRPGPP